MLFIELKELRNIYGYIDISILNSYLYKAVPGRPLAGSMGDCNYNIIEIEQTLTTIIMIMVVKYIHARIYTIIYTELYIYEF